MALWPILWKIISTGDTFSFQRDIAEAEARRAWVVVPNGTFVAAEDDKIYGT
ncbi:hypothetical protein OAJ57_00535 [Alphaproteobacteria bacterium]|nr:hypothetical protein [Alphaproteobacteria bacterium]